MSFKVSVVMEITQEKIQDLIITAFEGGSNYWITDWRRRFKGDNELLARVKKANPTYYEYIFHEGCSLVIEDAEGVAFKFDTTDVENGLNLMAAKYPWHIRNVIAGEDDAETADVFLQCCLFGEVIYG